MDQSTFVTTTPLWDFNSRRARILSDVVDRTSAEFSGQDLDLLLGESLFTETARLRGGRRLGLSYLFTLSRRLADLELWKEVRRDILKSPDRMQRKRLLETVSRHYAEEIGGHFSPRVYSFTTSVVPWGFRWLLNAASVKSFMPWGMKQSIEDQVRIEGELKALHNISKKGTVLLVPTHQSNMDSLLIGYIIYLINLPPFAYGAGLNLFTNPVLSFFMNSLGAYTVDRKKKDRIYKETLKNYSAELLREGVHSVFFPGGGRSRSGAIESHPKLGLLGTGLQAQIENLRNGKPNPNVYIVPMVTSYHFVLEALSLIEDYLLQEGRHRFMGADTEEAPKVVNMGRFLWKFFATKTNITLRFGSPLDVFGNPVDSEGRSIGPNGTIIDPKKWLTTQGELKSVPQRDQEYTRELGKALVDSYYCNNTVLSSHAVAFSYFMSVRKKYPRLDLYRFLRLSMEQRSIPLKQFFRDAQETHSRLRELANDRKLFLSPELQASDVKTWVRDGLHHLGLLHDAAVVRVTGGHVTTDDMNLLYYYRNRLSGYGLSLLGEHGRPKILRGELDEKGFLA